MSEVSCLVVIPAYNEEELISQTLIHLKAALKSRLEQCFVLVVCDSCADHTAEVARKFLTDFPSAVLEVEFQSVGAAREFGVRVGLQLRPDVGWLAFTDADTLVGEDWLSRQLELHYRGIDAYFGRVGFESDTEILKKFAEAYEQQTLRRVHGANMGLSVESYAQVGGIPRIAAHEDRVLSERLESAGFNLYWDERATVITSNRTDGRAPEGFAATLKRFAQANVLAS